MGSHCALLPKCESESNVQSGLSQHNARDAMSAEHRLGKLKDIALSNQSCQSNLVTLFHETNNDLNINTGWCSNARNITTEVSWSLVTMKPVKPVSLLRKAVNHLRDARNSEHLTWCLTYD